MSYYHVIATWNPDNPTTKVLFADISESDLKAKFVKPYLKGQHVLAGNDQIDVYGITKLMIIKTDERSEAVRSKLNDESLRRIDQMNSEGDLFIISSGSGYAPEDIREGGQDVTKDFITGSVGSKKGTPWYITLLLTVVAGVLIAGIVWYVGWK